MLDVGVGVRTSHAARRALPATEGRGHREAGHADRRAALACGQLQTAYHSRALRQGALTAHGGFRKRLGHAHAPVVHRPVRGRGTRRGATQPTNRRRAFGGSQPVCGACTGHWLRARLGRGALLPGRGRLGEQE
eukprot:scaffold122442_cov69-Phaeocystis_antarctica.AAC.2